MLTKRDHFPGGRKKALCCQVSKAPPPPLYCELTTCDLDPLSCSQDKDEVGNPLYSRDVGSLSTAGEEGGFSRLEERGPPRDGKWWLVSLHLIHQLSRTYPTPAQHLNNMQRLQGIARRWWFMNGRVCNNPSVTSREITDTTPRPPIGGQVEHGLPALIGARFPAVAHHGQQWAPRPAGYMRSDRNGGTRPWGQVTPEGPPTTEPAMSNEAFWREQWNADSLPANLPRVAAGSPDIRNPSQRIYEALGSNTNPLQFTLLQDSVNRIKGAIESYSSPMDKKKFENYVNDALDSANSETERDTSIQSFMAPLRETRGVFQYLNADDVITRVDRTIEAVHSQLQLIELHIPEARG